MQACFCIWCLRKAVFHLCFSKQCVHKVSRREVSLRRSKKSFLRVVDSTQKTDILSLVETESHTLVSCLLGNGMLSEIDCTLSGVLS